MLRTVENNNRAIVSRDTLGSSGDEICERSTDFNRIRGSGCVFHRKKCFYALCACGCTLDAEPSEYVYNRRAFTPHRETAGSRRETRDSRRSRRRETSKARRVPRVLASAPRCNGKISHYLLGDFEKKSKERRERGRGRDNVTSGVNHRRGTIHVGWQRVRSLHNEE